MVSTVCLADPLLDKKRPLEEASPKDVKRIKTHARKPSKGAAHLPSSYIASRGSSLLNIFIEGVREMESYKKGKPVVVNGQTLSIPAVTVVARHNASATLDESPAVKDRVLRSRNAITSKVEAGISIYGLTTGFGGSADTRTENILGLGLALLQHQPSGVLPSSNETPSVLPLLDPLSSTSMPESWVRGAILVRMNSLTRGHSGVRWELIEKLGELLRENIVPVVPLRTSISASGDLSPLSYIAGALMGNPSIRVFDGPSKCGHRQIVSSRVALERHGITPLAFSCKEALGVLNGTAFSASTASLALNDALHLALLSLALTAMGTEALAGLLDSFDEFIHSVARPHPGQVEVARIILHMLEGSRFALPPQKECHINEDRGKLRQDRYAIRTAPQFLGPQVEDILHAFNTVTLECNSTTDNPLVDGETGDIHHGGNFQAMSVSNAMEKTRLALHHIGKIMFAQATELINPALNRGLPPNLAATEPSLDYFAKGIDIGIAAYVSELGHLASPVSTHIQSAEMHNQAVNSLALISARATITSLDILAQLMASYLLIICQALDLRALQTELFAGIEEIVSDELIRWFNDRTTGTDLQDVIFPEVSKVIRDKLDSTSSMDVDIRMQTVAGSCSNVFLKYFTHPRFADASSVVGKALSALPAFQSAVSRRAAALHSELRIEYLCGKKGPAPASRYLNRTRPLYEFVRLTLGIKMRGIENLNRFENGIGSDEETVGQSVSRVYEAIRDGKLQQVLVGLF